MVPLSFNLLVVLKVIGLIVISVDCQSLHLTDSLSIPAIFPISVSFPYSENLNLMIVTSAGN